MVFFSTVRVWEVKKVSPSAFFKKDFYYMNQSQANAPEEKNGAIKSVNGNSGIKFEPKKFLFVSEESLSGDVAWALVREGHQVKIYVKAKHDADVYNGFLERVDAWEPYKDWADVIIFDDVGFGEIADKMRRQGRAIIGGSAYTDRLEIDREFGQAELKRHGVNTLPNWQFSDYDQGISFLKEHPDRYVFKPCGNVHSAYKNLLFIGEEEDGKDLIEILSQNKHVWQKKTKVFQLQKFVSGVEIAVGAFFNGTDFALPINVNFEHKRVFPGDIGPLTGDMGALMFWSSPNMLFRETLGKMLPALRESGYRGYVDVNCIVNGRGIYPLEFTSRFGYPTISVQMEGIQTPVGEWLADLGSGALTTFKVRKGFQIGVEIFVPTLLSDERELVEAYRDLPIFFKKNKNFEGIHIQDVKVEEGVWRIAGESGALLVVTGQGSTAAEASSQAYSRIQNILIQNMFYRTDIGSRWGVDSDRLQTWGYLQ